MTVSHSARSWSVQPPQRHSHGGRAALRYRFPFHTHGTGEARRMVAGTNTPCPKRQGTGALHDAFAHIMYETP
jgi:hypothetical protein